jgi:phosphatidylglycerophosphate synthase
MRGMLSPDTPTYDASMSHQGAYMYELQRRPIKLRSANWSTTLASSLATAGVTPNQVSVASSLFAIAGSAAFLSTIVLQNRITVAAAFVAAAVFIQCRLLCNMLDGMIAVENGKATKSGELFNEIPDRISDTVLLAAAGYSITGNEFSIALGWLAACLSLMTAYVRAFGARYMTAQDFCGPMAKQQRMFALTAGSIIAALQYALTGTASIITLALTIISVGAGYTAYRRTSHLKRAMEDEQC